MSPHGLVPRGRLEVAVQNLGIQHFLVLPRLVPLPRVLVLIPDHLLLSGVAFTQICKLASCARAKVKRRQLFPLRARTLRMYHRADAIYHPSHVCDTDVSPRCCAVDQEAAHRGQMPEHLEQIWPKPSTSPPPPFNASSAGEEKCPGIGRTSVEK